MTLDDYIKFLMIEYYEDVDVELPPHECKKIADLLEELKVTRIAFELACKRLEILDKKLGGTCQLNSEQYLYSILKMAREQYDT